MQDVDSELEKVVIFVMSKSRTYLLIPLPFHGKNPDGQPWR